MSKEILAGLQEVLAGFDFRGIPTEAEKWGSGHINDTYRLTVCQGGATVHYILQRINTAIFRKPDELMENIRRVTEHIGRAAEKMDDPMAASRCTLTLLPTREGGPLFKDAAGGHWRCYLFIEGAHTVDAVTSPEQAYQAARAFGAFQRALADLPGAPLHETIPGFHDTPARFQHFLQALKEDKLGRAALCRKEIDFVLAHERECATVVERLASGALPSRVTHNDTKINNVMLDDRRGEGICVIDLDTVMPGSVLYDFGDEVRTTTMTAAEDERDLSLVHFETRLFKPLLEGYLSSAGDFLTAEERRLLPFSGRLLTFECGMRFLSDFLEGDVYFKVHRDGHNLDRCRTQFELVAQMERQADDLQKLV